MNTLWKTYLTIVLGAVVVFFFIPGDTWTQTVVKVGIGWVAAASIVFGVRRNKVACPAALVPVRRRGVPQRLRHPG